MKKAYEKLKKEVNRKGFGPGCHTLIEELFEAARDELAGCGKIDLSSKVEGKSCFSFVRGGERSQPVNRELFKESDENHFNAFRRILQGKRPAVESIEITRSIYKVAVKAKAGKQDIAGTMTQTETGKETRENLAAGKFRYLLDHRQNKGTMNLKGEAVSQRSIADMINLAVEINATLTAGGPPAPEISMRIHGPLRMTEKVMLKNP